MDNESIVNTLVVPTVVIGTPPTTTVAALPIVVLTVAAVTFPIVMSTDAAATLLTTAAPTLVQVLIIYDKAFLDLSRIEVLVGRTSSDSRSTFTLPQTCMELHGCCSMQIRV